VRLIFSILVIFLSVNNISGQEDTSKQKSDTLSGRVYLLQSVKRDGVTLPEVEIKEVTVVGRPRLTNKREFRRYDRFILNIKRVYPYARMVRIKLNQVNEALKNIPDEKDRKRYMKDFEKSIFSEFEDDISQLTLTQGRLLIKLIDRETQNSSYELIRDYRGKISAVFWQGIARIFGTNLKEEYDPYGEDTLIEFIIMEIDAGNL